MVHCGLAVEEFKSLSRGVKIWSLSFTVSEMRHIDIGKKQEEVFMQLASAAAILSFHFRLSMSCGTFCVKWGSVALD